MDPEIKKKFDSHLSYVEVFLPKLSYFKPFYVQEREQKNMRIIGEKVIVWTVGNEVKQARALALL